MSATVYLIGAGPGDPGLMTIAGAEKLRQADVVVYDYLANSQLLEICPAACKRIYVGKSGSHHTLSQDQINALLVEEAKRADVHVIARLKGGDPYVFGRGGEEGEYLHQAGIPFVVIPGVTSGIAAPAYAGIPVTHRDITSTITLITGHEREDAAEGSLRVNYQALAQLKGTLVFYMGVKSLPHIAARLIAGGMSPDTPAAVIRWGTHPKQHTVTATIATIADAAARAKITAPAITIVGEVISLRDTLNWFEHQPLFGKKIIVTRTRQQASELSRQLAGLGADVLEAPTIELAEPDHQDRVDHALRDLCTRQGSRKYDWLVLTSVHGVNAMWRHLRAQGCDARVLADLGIAAIGPATADALMRIGIQADVLPEKFVGEELAAAIKNKLPDIAGKHFLLLRADIARPALRDALLAAGAVVDDIAIYRTVKPQSLPADVLTALKESRIDWITFTSASTAENFVALLPQELRSVVQEVKLASIGPITTAAMNQLQMPPTAEAKIHTIPGLVTAIVEKEKPSA